MIPVEIDDLQRRVGKLEEDNKHLIEIVMHLAKANRITLDSLKIIREAFGLLAKGNKQ